MAAPASLIWLLTGREREWVRGRDKESGWAVMCCCGWKPARQAGRVCLHIRITYVSLYVHTRSVLIYAALYCRKRKIYIDRKSMNINIKAIESVREALHVSPLSSSTS
jgi:hypothetical protein